MATGKYFRELVVGTGLVLLPQAAQAQAPTQPNKITAAAPLDLGDARNYGLTGVSASREDFMYESGAIRAAVRMDAQASRVDFSVKGNNYKSSLETRGDRTIITVNGREVTEQSPEGQRVKNVAAGLVQESEATKALYAHVDAGTIDPKDPAYGHVFDFYQPLPNQARAALPTGAELEQQLAQKIAHETGLGINGLKVKVDGTKLVIDYQMDPDSPHHMRVPSRQGGDGARGTRIVIDTKNVKDGERFDQAALVTKYTLKDGAERVSAAFGNPALKDSMGLPLPATINPQIGPADNILIQHSTDVFRSLAATAAPAHVYPSAIINNMATAADPAAGTANNAAPPVAAIPIQPAQPAAGPPPAMTPEQAALYQKSMELLKKSEVGAVAADKIGANSGTGQQRATDLFEQKRQAIIAAQGQTEQPPAVTPATNNAPLPLIRLDDGATIRRGQNNEVTYSDAAAVKSNGRSGWEMASSYDRKTFAVKDLKTGVTTTFEFSGSTEANNRKLDRISSSDGKHWKPGDKPVPSMQEAIRVFQSDRLPMERYLDQLHQALDNSSGGAGGAGRRFLVQPALRGGPR